MDLILNDLSIHEQFQDIVGFREAVGRMMTVRNVARRFGREVYCHGSVLNRKVSPNQSMNQAIGSLSREEQSALRAWLTKHGPFWEDMQVHGPDDYLESDDEIVTDTALGEAAFCCISGIDRQLVSFTPSRWNFTPVAVTSVTSDRTIRNITNWWDASALENALQNAEPPVTTWRQLESSSIARFRRLTFSEDSFRPLDGRPFVHAAAHRIISLLSTLDRLMGSVDGSGRRTPEGQRIYQDHFTGANAWFSDSSTSEKSEFENELTFRHPEEPGQWLFCTWHGKVRTEVVRVHFSWPVSSGGPLYVVYVGPKLTKR